MVRGGGRDDVAGGGNGAGEAGDGAGDLVDFGEEGDAGEFAGEGGLVWGVREGWGWGDEIRRGEWKGVLLGNGKGSYALG